MDHQAYKDLARQNGYNLGSKTDAELLADYSFHKAACVGMEEELFASAKDEMRGLAMASFHYPHRVRFMMALDAMDNAKTPEETWLRVCEGSKKKSECHDEEGNLKLEKL